MTYKIKPFTLLKLLRITVVQNSRPYYKAKALRVIVLYIVYIFFTMVKQILWYLLFTSGQTKLLVWLYPIKK